MIKDLENLPYFTLAQMAMYFKDKKTAWVYASNRIKKKELLSIREWTYVTDSKVKEYIFSWKINTYKEFIATNLIYIPSYLSLEYVLYEKWVITENVYNFTLVSTKKTAKFENTFWKFLYKTIKKDLFFDYEIIKNWYFTVYKATAEKALFDFLYLKENIIFEEGYFKELRLNIEKININKFEKIVKKSKVKKMEKVLIYLKKLKWL